MTEDIELRRRRAAYRATHRGTKEMDIIIGRFAEAQLASMDAARLEQFERFLALPDPTLAAWFSRAETPVEPDFAALITAMRRFHGLDAETHEGSDTSR